MRMIDLLHPYPLLVRLSTCLMICFSSQKLVPLEGSTMGPVLQMREPGLESLQGPMAGL